MGATRNVLTVFVASPGDVTGERESLAAAATRVNRITGRDWGWEIDLRGWEDTLPGYARPQELINPDVDECDVFIGVLWKRWGQATGTHTSGFEEELERATRRREATGAPEIMLYLRDIDAEERRDPGPQLQRVLSFRSEVDRARNLMYKAYSDLPQFEMLLFEHLMRVLGQRATTAKGPVSSEPPAEASLLRVGQLVPRAQTLLDLCSDPQITVTRLVDRWEQGSRSSEIPLLPCGVGPDGLYVFDIFDSSHTGTLLVGTTGSGKSQALLSITASLALSIPPNLLRVTFLDLKWDSYVRALETFGAVDGGAPDGAAYEAILSEVKRRERLLVGGGARDVREFWHRFPERRPELPYWLVCVDEVRGLIGPHLDGLDRLVAATQAARALGIHVIFGSQVIAGVGSGIRGACTRRICLRVAEHADSLDVVGVAEAATFPADAYGLAIVREGSDQARVVRFGWMGSESERIGDLVLRARSQFAELS